MYSGGRRTVLSRKGNARFIIIFWLIAHDSGFVSEIMCREMIIIIIMMMMMMMMMMMI